MAITANKKFWTEFIDIYHSLPSLWNTKEENYNNRESRIVAWNKLVEKLQEVEPDANQDSVKRKINTFRSNFNREVRKIRQTQREQGAELYNPTLWYFDHLSFLLNQEKYNGVSMEDHYEDETTLMGHTTAKCDILQQNETTVESLNQIEEFVTSRKNDYEKPVSNKLNHSPIKQIKLENPTIVDQEETRLEYTTLTNVEDVLETLTTSPAKEVTHSHIQYTTNETNHLEQNEKPVELRKYSTRKIPRSNVNRKSKLRFKSQNPFTKQYLSNSKSSTDEADIYGQSWACGFRKLTPEQKLYAKKAIDDILLLGQLNALKLHTVFMNSTLLERQGLNE